MTTVFTTNNNNINAGTGVVTCGNINLITTSERGIYWYDGNTINSRIYVGNDLVISSDDNVYIKLNQGTGYTNGKLFVEGGMVVGEITTNNNSINAGTGNVSCGGITVSGGSNVLTRSGQYTFMNSSGFSKTTEDVNNIGYRLYCDGRIGCGSEINVWSDKRIKKDIKNIEPSACLSIIDNITPKTFSYIDFLKNQNTVSVGFIAQDILEVFPEATSKNVDIIPNIYSIGILREPDLIEFENKNISDFEFSDCSSIKLKVFVNNLEQFVNLKEIVNETTFRITPPIMCEITDNSFNKIFIYGQEVNDLLSIEKNAIFTYAVGAIKQLNMEIKTLKDEMKELKELVYLTIKK